MPLPRSPFGPRTQMQCENTRTYLLCTILQTNTFRSRCKNFRRQQTSKTFAVKDPPTTDTGVFTTTRGHFYAQRSWWDTFTSILPTQILWLNVRPQHIVTPVPPGLSVLCPPPSVGAIESAKWRQTSGFGYTRTSYEPPAGRSAVCRDETVIRTSRTLPSNSLRNQLETDRFARSR